MIKKIAMVCILLFLSFFSYGEIVNAGKKGRFYWEAKGDILWDIKTNKKIIALTFDDGPHPRYTKEILKILNQYHAKATFFVVGQRAKNYPSLIKEMHTNGHEIGNHTYDHPIIGRITTQQLEEEIKKTDTIIHEIIGKSPSLFRPPGGEYSERVVNAAKKGHHLIVMWSWTQDTKDWSNPGTGKIINKVCENAKPGNIILFHDFGRNRTQTVNALAVILERLSKEGYQFVTVSELLSKQNIPAKR